MRHYNASILFRIKAPHIPASLKQAELIRLRQPVQAAGFRKRLYHCGVGAGAGLKIFYGGILAALCAFGYAYGGVGSHARHR